MSAIATYAQYCNNCLVMHDSYFSRVRIFTLNSMTTAYVIIYDFITCKSMFSSHLQELGISFCLSLLYARLRHSGSILDTERMTLISSHVTVDWAAYPYSYCLLLFSSFSFVEKVFSDVLILRASGLGLRQPKRIILRQHRFTQQLQPMPASFYTMRCYLNWFCRNRITSFCPTA